MSGQVNATELSSAEMTRFARVVRGIAAAPAEVLDELAGHVGKAGVGPEWGARVIFRAGLLQLEAFLEGHDLLEEPEEAEELVREEGETPKDFLARVRASRRPPQPVVVGETPDERKARRAALEAVRAEHRKLLGEWSTLRAELKLATATHEKDLAQLERDELRRIGLAAQEGAEPADVKAQRDNLRARIEESRSAHRVAHTKTAEALAQMHLQLAELRAQESALSRPAPAVTLLPDEGEPVAVAAGDAADGEQAGETDSATGGTGGPSLDA